MHDRTDINIEMPGAQLLVWPAMTFAFSLTFFPALKLELENTRLFPIAFSHVVLAFLAGALALTCLILLLCWLFNARWRKIAALTLISLASLAWIKSNILVWDHTIFDGNRVNWEKYGVENFADLALCLSVALFAVFRHEWLIRNRSGVCAFIVLAQILYLAWLSPLVSNKTFDELLAQETVSTKPKTAEILSRKQNLILIVLDTFQSDIFAELIAARPAIASGLKGFTFFYNAASVYPSTEVSLPGIFTGIDYENQMPYDRYLYQSYLGPTSITAKLMQEGYYVEVDRWGSATPIPYLSRLASNFVHERLPSMSTVEDMAMVALYSILPQFGKRIIHQQVSKRVIDVQDVRDNYMTFVRNLPKLGVQLIDQPVAKIIHLKGPHVPLRRYDRYGFDYFAAASDPGAVSTEVETSRDNFKAVALQSVLAVNAYLDKLKRAQAYDNAAIFVLGDHGAGLQGQDFVLPAGWPATSSNDTISANLQTSAIPLLLVKRPMADGSMVSSAAPVSLGDVNCTVFRELGVAQPALCMSLFDSTTASRPSRRFLWSDGNKLDRSGYLPVLREFLLKGPVWAGSSWKRSGREFAAGGVVSTPHTTTYNPGETIRFGSGGNAAQYQTWGWAEPADGFTWTVGKQASMAIPLPSSSPEPLMLEATLSPLVVAGKLDRQLVDVYANGEKIGKWVVAENGRYRAIIPSRLSARDLIELRFDLPDATSLAQLGVDDNRTALGLQVKSLSLHTTTYRPGETIQFGHGGNAAQYQTWGWAEPEDGFAWTVGKQASLAIPLPSSNPEPLMLEATLSPLVVAGKLERQLVDVYANGEKVGEWVAAEGGRYKAAVPARLNMSGVIELRFDLPDATSPAQLGVDDNRTVLGIQMQSVTLHTTTTYNPGETIRFGSGGNAAQYQTWGWAEPADGFTWTVGKQASMAIPLPSSNPEPLMLEAMLSPLVVAGKLDRQLVDVYANGEKVEEWVAAEGGRYIAAIPARLSASGLIELRFDLPNATSLSQLGVDDNRAVLGLRVQSITLHTTATYHPGETIRFGSGGNAAQYQGWGWAEPADGFAWTVGKQASMAIPLPSSNPQPLMLEAMLSPLVVAGKLDRQLVDVYANGEKVGEWVAAESGRYIATIPARLSASGVIELRFDLPDATSLAQLGVNDNRAVLGLRVQSITLHATATYHPGEMIRFGSGGNAAQYQTWGWAEPGDGFTWTVGKQASMAIPLPSSNPEPLMLEATLSPLVVAGKLDRQLIDVYANGEKVGEWVAAEGGQFKAAIPARLSTSGVIELRFDLPNATSLAQLGVNDNRAVLGLRVRSITLHTTATYNPGETIRFGSGGNAAQYQTWGWAEPADGFTWTVGKQASMAIPLPSSNPEPLMLEATLSPLVVAGKLDRQLVDVYANGEKIGKWVVAENGPYKAIIPARLSARDLIELRFDLPDATSPAQLGVDDNRTVLGVQVQSITLHTATTYNPGETIRFGSGGNAAQYQTWGWAEPADGFTWTVGKQASMVIPLPSSNPEPLMLEATLSPLVVAGKLDRQLVDVYANGEKVGEWVAAESGQYKAIVPARLSVSGVIELRFDLPDATSLAQLGVDDNRTVLGIQVKNITLH
jgi:hypothetical protein